MLYVELLPRLRVVGLQCPRHCKPLLRCANHPGKRAYVAYLEVLPRLPVVGLQRQHELEVLGRLLKFVQPHARGATPQQRLDAVRLGQGGKGQHALRVALGLLEAEHLRRAAERWSG